MSSFSFKIIEHSRTQNKNAVALASYRSGEKLKDNKTKEIHNQRKSHKSKVMHSEIIGWNGSRSDLWNASEKADKRKDAVTSREMMFALPHEITHKERVEICRKFGKIINKRYGCAVDSSIHAPDKKGDKRNYHAHILITTRAVENGIFSKKKYRDLNHNPQEVKALRKLFSDIQNEYLSDENKVSHLSCKAQGKEKKYERIGFHSYHQNRENNDLKELKLQSNILKYKREETWEMQQELYQSSKNLYEQSQQNFKEKSEYISVVKDLNKDLKSDFNNAQNLKKQLANVYEDRQRIDEQFTVLRSERIKSNWHEQHQNAKNQINETINILKVEQEKQNLIIQAKLETKNKVQGLVQNINNDVKKVNEIKQIIAEKQAILKDKYDLISNEMLNNKIKKDDIKTAINNENINSNYSINQLQEKANEQLRAEQKTEYLSVENEIKGLEQAEENRYYEREYLEFQEFEITKEIGELTSEIEGLENEIKGFGERRIKRNNELGIRFDEQAERIAEIDKENDDCIKKIKEIEPNIKLITPEQQTEFNNNKLNYVKQVQGITTEETPDEIKELKKATNDFIKAFNIILDLINKAKKELRYKAEKARSAEIKKQKAKDLFVKNEDYLKDIEEIKNFNLYDYIESKDGEHTQNQKIKIKIKDLKDDEIEELKANYKAKRTNDYIVLNDYLIFKNLEMPEIIPEVSELKQTDKEQEIFTKNADYLKNIKEIEHFREFKYCEKYKDIGKYPNTQMIKFKFDNLPEYKISQFKDKYKAEIKNDYIVLNDDLIFKDFGLDKEKAIYKKHNEELEDITEIENFDIDKYFNEYKDIVKHPNTQMIKIEIKQSNYPEDKQDKLIKDYKAEIKNNYIVLNDDLIFKDFGLDKEQEIYKKHNEEIKDITEIENFDIDKYFNEYKDIIKYPNTQMIKIEIKQSNYPEDKQDELIKDYKAEIKNDYIVLNDDLIFKHFDLDKEKETKKLDKLEADKQAKIDRIDILSDNVKLEGSEENIKSRVYYIDSLSDDELKGYLEINQVDIDKEIPLNKQVKDASLQKANDKLRASQTAKVAKSKSIKI